MFCNNTTQCLMVCYGFYTIYSLTISNLFEIVYLSLSGLLINSIKKTDDLLKKCSCKNLTSLPKQILTSCQVRVVVAINYKKGFVANKCKKSLKVSRFQSFADCLAKCVYDIVPLCVSKFFAELIIILLSSSSLPFAGSTWMKLPHYMA